MKIKLVMVGKNKDQWIKSAIEEYIKRLSGFCQFEFLCVQDASHFDIKKQKLEEERNIIKLIKNDSYIVLLDRKGSVMTSDEFAKKLDNWMQSTSTITFIIGGSNGVSDILKSKAHTIISFGKLTFTHQMMRVILLEQIYRAYTILSGKSYHK